MRTNLFKYVLAPALAMAAVMATPPAHAANVTVPFNFTVAGKMCPAGTYRVEKSGQLGIAMVTLRGISSTLSFRWSLAPGDPAPTDTRVILNFNQVGANHSLRSVQYGAGVTAQIKEKVIAAESPAMQSSPGQ